MLDILNKTRKTALQIFIFVMLLIVVVPAHADEKKRVYMSMDYRQVIGHHKVLTVEVRYREDRSFIPVTGVPIKITMDDPDGDSLLAVIYSNEEGIANLAIEKDFNFIKDEEGEYTLNAVFEGNKTFRKAAKDVDAKDLLLSAEFKVNDSVKTIVFEARELISDTSSRAPEEIDVEVYVERLYQDMEVADGEILNGKGQISFPDGIPGDKNGNLTIRILVDERDYGVVEMEEIRSWGVPTSDKQIKENNTATISYVVFMIVSIIVIAIVALFFSKRVVNNKHE